MMHKNYLLPHIVMAVTLLAFILIGLASTSSAPAPTQQPVNQKPVQQAQQQKQQQQSVPPQAPGSAYFTGSGGKGMSLAVLAPRASGLANDQGYLPTLVQGEFVSNISGYSAISVLDRERLDEQYAELLSGYYADDAKEGMDLGHLTPTTHIMGGNITRTATGYALQMQITKTADKMTTASYSGTFTFAELDNLTGIRRASLELLNKMGVTLTAQAQKELAGAAMTNHVSAQTALARGITAQKQGTEVAALSYYFQAATFDPSLLEATNRSSILNANISSGNIGDNVRNDIQWRRDWVARLTETEQFFDSFNRTESMPYTLFYVSNEIKQGTINYQNETVTLSIETHLHGSGIWTLSIERALQAVWDGLNATKRKDTWQLANWPRQGVTNLNVFTRKNNNFSVVFELLNDQNKVIGRQTLQSGGSWELSWSDRPIISVSADDRKTLNFQNVNANDITDKMSIRIASINGANAETAARNGVLQIRAIARNEFDINTRFRFARGELQGFVNNNAIIDRFPNSIWGDPVVSIGEGAFRNAGLTTVVIPNTVTSIDSEAFSNNKLTSLTIGANVAMKSNSFSGDGFQSFPDHYNLNGRKADTYNRSIFRFNKGEIQGFMNDNATITELVIPDTIWGIPVTSIGAKAFKDNNFKSVIIPDSVTYIGSEALSKHSRETNNDTIRIITIGANVSMHSDSFQYTYDYYDERYGLQAGKYNRFYSSYERNKKKAGIYTYAYDFGYSYKAR